MENTKITNAVETIKTAILQSQYRAGKAANAEQLSLYYGICKYVSENSRNKFWGTGAIESISEKLQRELPGLRGFSASNMKNMRQFYEEWAVLPNSAATAAELSAPKLPAVAGDLQSSKSTAVATNLPQVAINTELLVSSEPKNNSITREEFLSIGFSHHKDEYILDYINLEELGVRKKEDIDEKVVEKGIIYNIEKFIMNFGRDFAFVGDQYHLEVFDVDHFTDLLFFNRELNCLVVVELKLGAFKSSYLGQLTTYLRLVDDLLKKPHENPAIGIILCQEAKKEYVEYVIQDYDKPMGVATYKTSADMPEKLRKALPPIEDMKKLLKDNRN